MTYPIEQKKICRNCIYYLSKFNDSIIAPCLKKGYKVSHSDKKCRKFEMRTIRSGRVYELTDYAVGKK